MKGKSLLFAVAALASTPTPIEGSNGAIPCDNEAQVDELMLHDDLDDYPPLILTQEELQIIAATMYGTHAGILRTCNLEGFYTPVPREVETFLTDSVETIIESFGAFLPDLPVNLRAGNLPDEITKYKSRNPTGSFFLASPHIDEIPAISLDTEKANCEAIIWSVETANWRYRRDIKGKHCELTLFETEDMGVFVQTDCWSAVDTSTYKPATMQITRELDYFTEARI